MRVAVQKRSQPEIVGKLRAAQTAQLLRRAGAFKPKRKFMPNLIGDNLAIRRLLYKADPTRFFLCIQGRKRLSLKQQSAAERAVGRKRRLKDKPKSGFCAAA